jgi:hypothetical protein
MENFHLIFLSCTGEPVLCNILHICNILPHCKKQYLGVWRADWVFGAPEITVNNAK